MLVVPTFTATRNCSNEALPVSGNVAPPFCAHNRPLALDNYWRRPKRQVLPEVKSFSGPPGASAVY